MKTQDILLENNNNKILNQIRIQKWLKTYTLLRLLEWWHSLKLFSISISHLLIKIILNAYKILLLIIYFFF